MATVNLHTGVLTSPKFAPLSDGALRLWLHGLCWCKEHLTDGFIPAGMVPTLHRHARKFVRELLVSHVPGKRALWEEVEGGYRVHDYADWQDSAESVQERRRKWRAAKRGVSRSSAPDSAVESTSESAPRSTPDYTPESPAASRVESREGSGGGVGGGCGGTARLTDDDQARPERLTPATGTSSSVVVPWTDSLTAGQLRQSVIELLGLWRQFGPEGAVRPVFERLQPRTRRDLADALRRKSLDEWQAIFATCRSNDYLAGRLGDAPITLFKALELADKIEAGEYRDHGDVPQGGGIAPGWTPPTAESRRALAVAAPVYVPSAARVGGAS